MYEKKLGNIIERLELLHVALGDEIAELKGIKMLSPEKLKYDRLQAHYIGCLKNFILACQKVRDDLGAMIKEMYSDFKNTL